MLFEQYHPQDLLTPSINDGGVNKLNSSLTSLDFYLLDDIDAYLSPIHSEKTKNHLITDSTYDNNEHQEEFFPDFDFSDIHNFEEDSDFLDNPISIDELELEKWISQSSFPSPPMDTNNSPLSNVEDTSSTFPSSADEYTMNTDMIVPPSPPLSSIGSSPAPLTKKSKLSVVERKIRKKDQNKTAAEKYRMKKKSERHQLLDRYSKLRNTNKELKLELENLAYRVHQFKQLFTDIVQIDLPTSK
jgi:hypothetical protein